MRPSRDGRRGIRSAHTASQRTMQPQAVRTTPTLRLSVGSRAPHRSSSGPPRLRSQGLCHRLSQPHSRRCAGISMATAAASRGVATCTSAPIARASTQRSTARTGSLRQVEGRRDEAALPPSPAPVAATPMHQGPSSGPTSSDQQ